MGNGNRQQLPPRATGLRTVNAGYEYLCPGAATHLGLRFQDRPTTAVDGGTFPATAWESSPSFLGLEYPFQTAMDLTGRQLTDRQSPPPAGLRFPARVDNIGTSARAQLTQLLKTWLLAKAVTAE